MNAILSSLLVASILLAGGLLLQRFASQASAAKYAVLLWTLVAVALCPAVMVAMRAAGIRPLVTIGNTTAYDPAGSQILAVVPRNENPSANAAVSWTAILLGIWTVGLIGSLFRLASGLHTVRLLRRTATPLHPDRIRSVAAALEQQFRRKPPPILSSERVGVPMAVGYFRPALLLPKPLAERLDHPQLTQVLMHEWAHAFRRDALASLFQRALGAVLWFHPLIHLANRRIDRLREEICDNYALRVSSPANYSATLLAIAESLSPAAGARFAPGLCQPAFPLHDRVAGLLDPRRSHMTNLPFRKSVAIAACLAGAALILSTVAGAAQENDYSHAVRVNKTWSEGGDSLTVSLVRGPSEDYVAGKTYEVSGTYKLASRDKAVLAAFVTSSGADAEIHHEIWTEQTTIVSKGEGKFTLRFHMFHKGAPHVSFYPAEGGNSICGVYF